MAKFDAYPKADTLLPDDLLITDGTRGTKTVKAEDAVYKMLESLPQMHRTIWRGKNLGPRYTAQQAASVANGTLTDIWLGDYWESDGVRWTIVDFEVANTAMQDMPATYLTIMPNKTVGIAEYIQGDDQNPAMQDTHIYRNIDEWQLYKFERIFGRDHILEHWVSFEGKFEDSSWESMNTAGPHDITYLKRKVCLLTEMDWFGCRQVDARVAQQWALHTSSTKQFAAFRYGWTPIIPEDRAVWLHSRPSRRYFGCVKRNEGIVMDVGTKQMGMLPYALVR